MSYTVYCIVGTLVYYFLSSILAYVFLYAGEIDTKSEWYGAWYFRGGSIFNSEYLSIGKFGYYLIMNLVGFTFVNIVTLQNVRHNPTLD